MPPLDTEAKKDSPVIDTTAESQNLSLTQKAGEAANQWLAKNRSLVLRQTPVWAQGFAAILIGLGAIAVAGGIFFRIDEVVTVQGQLRSIGGTVEVKTPAGGRIAEVLFEDGDVVERGQLLLKFDTRQAKTEKEMLTTQIDLEKVQLQTQIKIFDSQSTTLLGRQEVLIQRLKTKETILQNMSALVEEGGFQRLQYLEQQDQVFALKKDITDIEEQLSRLLYEKERLSLQSQKSIDRMKADLQKAEVQLQYQNVVSPIAGVVFDPKATKESVLNGGQRILSIVPQKGLFAEVYVPNKDIGWIKLGQEAKVRVDAFPFSSYGEISSEVSQIAADALEPSANQPFYRFPVKLKLKSNTLNSRGSIIPLKPGMAVTTNLKLRDKPVISIISDIFVDQTDSIKSIRQQ